MSRHSEQGMDLFDARSRGRGKMSRVELLKGMQGGPWGIVVSLCSDVIGFDGSDSKAERMRHVKNTFQMRPPRRTALHT